MPGQLSIGLRNELDGFFQAVSRLLQAALLNVAARKLLDVPAPPVANLLEDPDVTVVHAIHV